MEWKKEFIKYMTARYGKYWNDDIEDRYIQESKKIFRAGFKSGQKDIISEVIKNDN